MNWYTVYLRETEEIIASGTAKQAAAALGVEIGSFYTAVTRSRTRKNYKYDFVIEDVEEEDIE